MAQLDEKEKKQLMDFWSKMTIQELAEEFVKRRNIYDTIKAQSAREYHKFDLLRTAVIPKKMEDLGLDTAVVKGVGRVQIGHNMSAKQIDKVRLMEWMEANGHGDMVSGTINSSSLAAFIRTQIAQGGEIPDDTMIDISTYEVATVVKA